MDLLTAAESHAFQTFLSAMDYADLSPSEWALLNSTTVAPDDDVASADVLSRATKDLMALDARSWDSVTSQPYNLYTSRSPQRQHQHQTHSNSYLHRQAPYSRRESFPFLSNSKTQMQQLSIHPQQIDLHHPYSPQLGSSAPNSANTTPATPQSPFGFPDATSHNSTLDLGEPLSRQKRPPSPGTKRSSPFNARSASAKRARTSPPPSASTTNPAAAKPALLSPLQKKANHIQSEQKRRANIRRGYEALCDTVPALREAIREEEEAEARMNMGLTPSGKPSRSKRKKDAITPDGEKIDGRAGPKSENVVLSKTIEHINDLLSEQSSLLSRLDCARSALPSGHPALVPVCTPLWEREWKGGEGKIDGEDDENNDDGDDP